MNLQQYIANCLDVGIEKVNRCMTDYEAIKLRKNNLHKELLETHERKLYPVYYINGNKDAMLFDILPYYKEMDIVYRTYDDVKKYEKDCIEPMDIDSYMQIERCMTTHDGIYYDVTRQLSSENNKIYLTQQLDVIFDLVVKDATYANIEYLWGCHEQNVILCFVKDPTTNDYILPDITKDNPLFTSGVIIKINTDGKIFSYKKVLYRSPCNKKYRDIMRKYNILCRLPSIQKIFVNCACPALIDETCMTTQIKSSNIQNSSEKQSSNCIII